MVDGDVDVGGIAVCVFLRGTRGKARLVRHLSRFFLRHKLSHANSRAPCNMNDNFQGMLCD
jgi:hypothetical protein